MIILIPMKAKMMAKPNFNRLNMWMKLANRKYKERSPRIAKIFEVYRMNGSSGAMAKMAGMESTAKIKSVNSITVTTTNRGVAIFTPFSMVKKFPPLYSLLTLNSLWITWAPGLLLKSFS